MKIGILSDIHGNLPGLEAAWDLFETERIDQVVCLGDLVQYGPYPGEVIDFVRQHDMDIVQGNCDRTVAKGRSDTGDDYPNIHWEQLAGKTLQWTQDNITDSQRKFLRKLPSEVRYQIGSRRILCVHGLPGKISSGIQPNMPNEAYDLLFRSNSCDVLALGHTHEMFLKGLGSRMIVNPGSIGGGTLPGEATVAVIEVDEENTTTSVCWHCVPFDVHAYEAKYIAEGLPEIFLRCFLLGRDPRGEWHTQVWRQKWAEQ
ncbi:MAG: YfcE family phosphodiesterase [Candidatus Fermentibacteraceae bacterium]|nr:YfcE family phosphodiesterase [Candidatus Fermentibacteraceae bacterium]